jgi:F-type H+-transporting ATPase subunit delta
MSDAVAERYARAIFEVGEEAGKLAIVAEHFDKLARAYATSHELRVALTDPGVDEEARARALRAVATRLGTCREALNAVFVMMKRRRLAELTATARRLVQLSDEKTGVLRAEVKSPKPLDEAFAEDLRRQLEKATGRRVLLDRSTDPSLIAGLILRIGSQVIDGSLKGRLIEFERRLARAS